MTVRSCETLPIPSNGAIRGGSCGRTYLSTCTFECDEGYRLAGSETRQCVVTSLNIMDWSGTTATCERRCNIKLGPRFLFIFPSPGGEGKKKNTGKEANVILNK